MDLSQHILSRVNSLLKRAKNELDATTYLIQGNFWSIATSRAWYAASHATRAILELLEENSSDNEHKLIQQFHSRIIETELLSVPFGKILQDLYYAHLKIDLLCDQDYLESEEAIEYTKQAGLFVSGLSNLISALLESFSETVNKNEHNNTLEN